MVSYIIVCQMWVRRPVAVLHVVSKGSSSCVDLTLFLCWCCTAATSKIFHYLFTQTFNKNPMVWGRGPWYQRDQETLLYITSSDLVKLCLAFGGS
jgi:hypothetical protein